MTAEIVMPRDETSKCIFPSRLLYKNLIFRLVSSRLISILRAIQLLCVLSPNGWEERWRGGSLSVGQPIILLNRVDLLKIRILSRSLDRLLLYRLVSHASRGISMQKLWCDDFHNLINSKFRWAASSETKSLYSDYYSYTVIIRYFWSKHLSLYRHRYFRKYGKY